MSQLATMTSARATPAAPDEPARPSMPAFPGSAASALCRNARLQIVSSRPTKARRHKRGSPPQPTLLRLFQSGQQPSLFLAHVSISVPSSSIHETCAAGSEACASLYASVHASRARVHLFAGSKSPRDAKDFSRYGPCCAESCKTKRATGGAPIFGVPPFAKHAVKLPQLQKREGWVRGRMIEPSALLESAASSSSRRACQAPANVRPALSRRFVWPSRHRRLAPCSNRSFRSPHIGAIQVMPQHPARNVTGFARYRSDRRATVDCT